MSIPGPQNLIGGDMQAGFYGEVPASELINGTDLANLIGLSAGTAQHTNEPWLKFAYEGKIQYVAKKTLRHSLSWDQINAAGAVFGKTITIDGKQYKVRLMRGAEHDPSHFSDADRDAIGSEWNKLMLPIHVNAPSSWAHPAYGGTSEDWGINYTDADLLTHNTHGNGSYSWMQEVRGGDSARRVSRGYTGASLSNSATATTTSSGIGWRPVLELISVPPEISGADEDLGTKSSSFSYAYTVTVLDGHIANITEKLNGEIVNSYDNPTELAREFTLTKELLKTSYYFQVNSIEIIVTDDLGISNTRTLIFSRGTSALPPETPLLEVVDRIDDIGNYIQGGLDAIGESVKGVDDSISIPTDPTFQQLADAIGGINTGKKWASGTKITASWRVTVSDLPFKPSYIAIIQRNNPIYASFYYNNYRYRIIGSQVVTGELPSGSEYVSDSGFSIEAGASSGVSCDWIAIE